MFSYVAATSAAIAPGIDDNDVNDLRFDMFNLLRWKVDGFGERHRSAFEGSDDLLACVSLECDSPIYANARKKLSGTLILIPKCQNCSCSLCK